MSLPVSAEAGRPSKEFTSITGNAEPIHAPRRYRLGLALSCGAAKGLAHIGVIQVLEEEGLQVDVVAGASMGAYVGSIWATGVDGQEMERLAREVHGKWGLAKLVDPVFPPRRGFILGEAIKRRLQKTVGDLHFEQLPRPIHVVATNLFTLERVIFNRGPVAPAVHASIAIPGVCAPVEIDGETYIDGGIADPLPVSVLESLGCDVIVAVNTIPTPAFMRVVQEREHELEVLRGRRPVRRFLNRHLNYFARGNVLDIMMRAVHGAQIRVAEEACRHADVVMRPLAVDAHWYEFNQPGKFIALGRRVAQEHVAQIKELLARKVAHENAEAHNSVAAVA
jgi:NTE family protein